MNYTKELIEEAEKLVEVHRPYALSRNFDEGKIELRSSTKAALITANKCIKVCYILDSAYEEHWQQVKECLENKLKQL